MQLKTSVDILHGGLEVGCDLTVEYTPGSPGVHTLRNGDPGYPPDPPEWDVTEVAIFEVNGRILSKPALLPSANIQEFCKTFSEEIEDAVTTAAEDAMDSGPEDED